MNRSPLTTAITVGALFLASLGTAPAGADTKGNNLVGVLLGIGALAIIVDKAKDRKKATASATQSSSLHSHNGTAAHRHNDVARTYGYDRRESTFRRSNKNRRHKLRQKMHHGHDAPKTCLRQRWTAQGWKTFTSKPCLNKHKARNHFHETKQTNHFHNGRGKIVTLKDLKRRRYD